MLSIQKEHLEFSLFATDSETFFVKHFFKHTPRLKLYHSFNVDMPKIHPIHLYVFVQVGVALVSGSQHVYCNESISSPDRYMVYRSAR